MGVSFSSYADPEVVPGLSKMAVDFANLYIQISFETKIDEFFFKKIMDKEAAEDAGAA